MQPAVSLSQIYHGLYVGFFAILVICITGLLIITPANAIQQSLRNNQFYYVIIIAVAYAVTFAIGISIFLSRKWTSRLVMKSIPKAWIPIEKEDVSKKVRKMIVASLTRSAVIAWDSRPRIDSLPATKVSEPDTRDAIVKPATTTEGKKRKGLRLSRRRRAVAAKDGETGNGTETEKEEGVVAIPPEQPVWGTITHVGWSSPTSPDLPNLQYITVVQELPHLIEARAVSVAPPDPDSFSNPPMPDLRAVDLLQRPPSTGLRDYINNLISIDIISNPANANEFLSAYEYARFSSQALTETQFRDLMKLFADVLRSIQPLSPAMLASLDIDPVESDIDDDNSASTSPVTPRSQSINSIHSATSRSGSEGTVRTAPSHYMNTSATTTTKRFPEFSTAPTTPRSRRQVIARSSSGNSFAQSRRPYNGDNSSVSSTSLASSQGSVIRLSATSESGALPYTLTIPGVR